jgi:hypothetical protein
MKNPNRTQFGDLLVSRWAATMVKAADWDKSATRTQVLQEDQTRLKMERVLAP